MLTKTFFLDIPERLSSPAAKLFVKIALDSEEALKSKPFVFMLPGGPGANHSHYEDYTGLSTHANIVFIDPRGCGLSSIDDPTTYTMDNYIDDIKIARELLNLKEIILLGKSCGAITALGFALQYPSLVSQLILSAGAPSFRFIETAKANVLARGTLQQREVCEKLWQGKFANNEEVMDFLKIMAPLYSYKVKLGVSFPARTTPKYPLSHEPLNQGFGGFLREFNFESRLHLIKCQTLILAGKEDWICDTTHSELMAKKIPNSQLIIFPESSHMMEIDVPELYFNAIQEFALTYKRC